MAATPTDQATGPGFDPTTAKILKNALDKSKQEVDQRLAGWQTSVDYRRGQPFDTDSDQDRVYVNEDAKMTRRKSTQLASQLPGARLKTEDPRVKPILGQFAQRLNKELRKAGTADAMWECTNDAVNAAGFGWVLIGFEARTEPAVVLAVDRATLDPLQAEAVAAAESGELEEAHGAELLKEFGVPTTTQDRVVSSRFYVRRGSPSDFLWDQAFERSNFNMSPWLGHKGRMSWSEAMGEFKLTELDKSSVCGGQAHKENLRNSDENTSNEEHLVVEYDEAFYYRAYYDPKETHFDCIYRIVFVKGKGDEPVIHEKWQGQKYLDKIGYVGSLLLPIQVLTLDYVSDDSIPPSDSALARPQVNEKIRSRTQMILQRERALPSRWHDVNRVDPLIAVQLMRGTFQGSIPVKGNGNAIIGEVARASYPPENFEFDRTINADLHEMWGMGENQLSVMSRGRRTAAESNNAQSNFNTQMSFQRARVAGFLTNIIEVLAGLLTLHGQGLPLPTPDEQNPMDVSQMAGAIDYSILPDTTMLLDAEQQAERNMKILDMLGKSGFLNPAPFVENIVRLLSDVDPAVALITPEPKDEPPAISYRFGGVQDLHDPLVAAMLIKARQFPDPQQVEDAIKALQAVDLAIRAGIVPPPPAAENDAGGPPNDPTKKPAPSGVGDDANPDWNSMSKVTKRSAKD